MTEPEQVRKRQRQRQRDRERERDRGREGDLASPLRTPIPSDQGPTLMASFNRYYFLTPNIATSVRASALGFGGDAHIQSTTCTHGCCRDDRLFQEKHNKDSCCVQPLRPCDRQRQRGPGLGVPSSLGSLGWAFRHLPPCAAQTAQEYPSRITVGENPAISLGLSLQRRSDQGE